MHTYTEKRLLPYSAEQVYALVVDIEKYPEFLPWCRAARILSHKGNSFLGELVISFNHLTERYTSLVSPTPPLKDYPGRIEVSLVDGPFRHLSNHWLIVPQPTGCEIELALEFEFKSKLLDKMLGGMFGRACEKMVGAFTARAEALYGKR